MKSFAITSFMLLELLLSCSEKTDSEIYFFSLEIKGLLVRGLIQLIAEIGKLIPSFSSYKCLKFHPEHSEIGNIIKKFNTTTTNINLSIHLDLLFM